MDIEIKQSLEKLLAVAKCLDSTAAQIEKLDAMIVRDINVFIYMISKNHGAERVQYFNTVYLDDQSLSKVVPIQFEDQSFSAFPLLCKLDMSVLRRSKVLSSNLFISFVVDLGKYYLFSKREKKDIDSERLTRVILSLKEIQKEIIEAPVKKPGSDVVECDASLKAKEEGNSVEPLEARNEDPQEETLGELMEKLNSLIGLPGVKQEVTSLINLMRIRKIRQERGFETVNVSMHLVFVGNPGTGKTTVARLLAKIYKQLGALEKGQLIEVDRSGLVAGYVGQTALKTQEILNSAMGGVLFIDEAYTLAKEGSDFGQEAIDTILKAMEDNRENLVVIVAGYPEPMEKFLDSNPGLKSRFNKTIHFEDYTEQELFSILCRFFETHGLVLSQDAEIKTKEYLKQLTNNKPENFANGREMRNLFEAVVVNQANRLAAQNEITDNELNEIQSSDLPEWVSGMLTN